MRIKDLRRLVGYAEARARLERVVQCYKAEYARGEKEQPLEWDDRTIYKLIESAAQHNNRYFWYSPSFMDKFTNFCVLRKVLANARARYHSQELDWMDINFGISSLRAVEMGTLIGKALKLGIPKANLRNLKTSIKNSLRETK